MSTSTRIKIRSASGRGSDKKANDVRGLQDHHNGGHHAGANSLWSKLPSALNDIFSAVIKPMFHSATQMLLSSSSHHSGVNQNGAVRNDAWRLSDEMKHMNEIQALLEKTQERQNWNFFVGHERFKTNFFLQFLNHTTARTYEAQVISGSLYSIRIWLVLQLGLCLKSFEILLQDAQSQAKATQDGTSTTNGDEIPKVEGESGYFQWAIACFLFMLGFWATYEKKWLTLNRQLCMNSITVLLEYQMIRAYLLNEKGMGVIAGDLNHSPEEAAVLAESLKGDNCTVLKFLAKLGILFPAFITYILILGSWMQFLGIVTFQLILANLIKTQQDNKSEFDMTYQVLLYTFIFAILEKIYKERFVINLTNQYQRKLFAEVINSGCAFVIVDPDGKITFYNEVFKSLLLYRLNFQSLPSNIYKMLEDNQQDMLQLQELMNNALKCTSEDQNNRIDLRRYIELRVPRRLQLEISRLDSSSVSQFHNRSSQNGQFERQGQNGGGRLQQQGDKQLHEMLRISCRVSHKSANRSLILCVQRIMDYQVQADLICEQTFYLQAYLLRFIDAVEQKIKQDAMKSNQSKFLCSNPMLLETTTAQRTGNNNGVEIEVANDPMIFMAHSLGNAPQMLYSLQQIQFQVRLMSIMSVAQTMWDGHRSENDFVIQAHLTQCIEQCSNLCKDHPTVTLSYDDSIPDVVNGDPDMLMLALQTLTEFALRYTFGIKQTRDSKGIVVNTQFDHVIEDSSSFLVSFQFRMPVNSVYDTKKIRRLFNELLPNEGTGVRMHHDEMNTYFLKRTIEYREYYEEFGIGLLLLPSLMHILEGKITIKIQNASVSKRRGFQDRRGVSGSGHDDTDQVSQMSGNSFFTTNNNQDKENHDMSVSSANGAAPANEQCLIIKFQVPLNQSEQDVTECPKPVMPVPQELSNRREGPDQVTKWISPLLYRQQQLMIETKSEMVMPSGQTYHHWGQHTSPMSPGNAAPQFFNELIQSGQPQKAMAQTPEIQMRRIDQMIFTGSSVLQTHTNGHNHQSVFRNLSASKSEGPPTSGNIEDQSDFPYMMPRDQNTHEIGQNEDDQLVILSQGIDRSTPREHSKKRLTLLDDDVEGNECQSVEEKDKEQADDKQVDDKDVNQADVNDKIVAIEQENQEAEPNDKSDLILQQIAGSSSLQQQQLQQRRSSNFSQINAAISVMNIPAANQIAMNFNNQQKKDSGSEAAGAADLQKVCSGSSFGLSFGEESKAKDGGKDIINCKIRKQLSNKLYSCFSDQLQSSNLSAPSSSIEEDQLNSADQQRQSSNLNDKIAAIKRSSQEGSIEQAQQQQAHHEQQIVDDNENGQNKQDSDPMQLLADSLDQQAQEEIKQQSRSSKNSRRISAGSSGGSSQNLLNSGSHSGRPIQSGCFESMPRKKEDSGSQQMIQVQEAANEIQAVGQDSNRNDRQAGEFQVNNLFCSISNPAQQLQQLEPQIQADNQLKVLQEEQKQNQNIVKNGSVQQLDEIMINDVQAQNELMQNQQQIVEEEQKVEAQIPVIADPEPPHHDGIGIIEEEKQQNINVKDDMYNDKDNGDEDRLDNIFDNAANSKDEENRSENMGTVFIDEMMPGLKLEFLTDKDQIKFEANLQQNEGGRENALVAAPQNQQIEEIKVAQYDQPAALQEQSPARVPPESSGQSESENDVDEPILTEEQKRDLAERRKRYLAEQRVRWKKLKEEEDMRNQEILRWKLENKSQNGQDGEEVAIVQMRLDDRLGDSGVNKEEGASRGKIKPNQQALNAVGELQQPNQPLDLLRQRRQQPDEAEVEAKKQSLEIKIRNIMQSIHDQKVKTDQNKHEHSIRHINMVPMDENEENQIHNPQPIQHESAEFQVVPIPGQFSGPCSINNIVEQQRHRHHMELVEHSKDAEDLVFERNFLGNGAENDQPRLLVNRQSVLQQQHDMQQNQEPVVQVPADSNINDADDDKDDGESNGEGNREANQPQLLQRPEVQQLQDHPLTQQHQAHLQPQPQVQQRNSEPSEIQQAIPPQNDFSGRPQMMQSPMMMPVQRKYKLPELNSLIPSSEMNDISEVDSVSNNSPEVRQMDSMGASESDGQNMPIVQRRQEMQNNNNQLLSCPPNMIQEEEKKRGQNHPYEEQKNVPDEKRGIQVLLDIRDVDFRHFGLPDELMGTLNNAKKIIKQMKQLKRHQSMQELQNKRNKDGFFALQLASCNDSSQNHSGDNNSRPNKSADADESSNSLGNQPAANQRMGKSLSASNKIKRDKNGNKNKRQDSMDQMIKNGNILVQEEDDQQSVSDDNVKIDDKSGASFFQFIQQQNLQHSPDKVSSQKQVSSFEEQKQQIQNESSSSIEDEKKEPDDILNAKQYSPRSNQGDDKQNDDNQDKQEIAGVAEDVAQRNSVNNMLSVEEMQAQLIASKQESYLQSIPGDLQQIIEESERSPSKSQSKMSSPVMMSGRESRNVGVMLNQDIALQRFNSCKSKDRNSLFAAKHSLIEEVKDVLVSETNKSAPDESQGVHQNRHNMSENVGNIHQPLDIFHKNDDQDDNSPKPQSDLLQQPAKKENIGEQKDDRDQPAAPVIEVIGLAEKQQNQDSSASSSLEPSQDAVAQFNNGNSIPDKSIGESKEENQPNGSKSEASAQAADPQEIQNSQPSAMMQYLKPQAAGRADLHQRRRSIRAPPKMPKRNFRNRYMLVDQCQKKLGPDNYFVQNKLLDEETKHKQTIKWKLNKNKKDEQDKENKDQEDEDDEEDDKKVHPSQILINNSQPNNNIY